jgi:tRNA acetyltransferase TAN1
LNLLITCQRNLEEQAIDEISNFLDEFGDSNPKISKTEFSGIIQVDTSVDTIEVITKIRKKICEEPWLIRFCSRLIPIQKECKSNLNLIRNEIANMISCINKDQTYRITIEKRNSQMKSQEIVSHIADLIPNKVSLEHPDWEIVIQVMGKITGIGIVPKNSILSVNREKRLDSC